jgi:Rad3-related DNA helicase
MTKYFTIPQLETPKEYLNYFNDIGFRSIISDLRRQFDLLGDYKKADEMTSLTHKFDAFVKYPDNWITLYEEKAGSHVVTLKPVFIDNYVNDYVFNRASHILLMSATILSKTVICESLGISDNEVASLRLGSTFPTKNRPIYYTPVGSMSFHKKADTFPALIKKVNEICQKYTTDRGIIHTHTFEIADILYKHCDDNVKNRFIYQKNYKDRSLAISAHCNTKGAILLAPAMHEGLDLYDDLGRFQIVCKIPYPSKSDPQIAMRIEISKKYYDWCAACKLIQSIGRIVRHENDYGDTYILDSGFEHFLDSEGGSLIPKWVLDAIII